MSDRHTDWPWLLQWVPRSWTTFKSDQEPRQLVGNVPDGAHLDIPPKGSWCLTWPPGLAIVLPSGHYVGLGVRYDYNSKTYQFPRIKLGKRS